MTHLKKETVIFNRSILEGRKKHVKNRHHFRFTNSVTSKKSPNVGDLGKLIVATGFEMLPKVQ